MIPNRQTDPIGYARFWMGDLFPLLQERADNMRLMLRSFDTQGTATVATGLRRLNRLANRGLLYRLPKKENSAYIFVPVEFLADHFLAGGERAIQASKHPSIQASKHPSIQAIKHDERHLPPQPTVVEFSQQQRSTRC